jgi:hypothetical protein
MGQYPSPVPSRIVVRAPSIAMRWPAVVPYADLPDADPFIGSRCCALVVVNGFQEIGHWLDES